VNAVLDASAMLIAGAGLIAFLSAAVDGSWRAGLAMGLTLWTAAGLLRLAVQDPSWMRLLAAAMTLFVRHLVVAGLRVGGR